MALTATIGSKPGEFDLQWHDGDTASLPQLTFRKAQDQTPLDLSGYGYIAQYEPVGQDRIDFTVDSSQAMNGILVLTPPLQQGLHSTGTWDLRQISGTTIIRTLIKGNVTILPTVSELP